MTLEVLIDTPIETLPFVDRHAIEIAASPQRAWEALLPVMVAAGHTRRTHLIAHALDCTPAEATGEWGAIGSAVPGFMVTRAIPPAVLALMGEHRFSRYALIFRIVERHSGLTELSAETRAEFPGLKGGIYRTLVISTRGHVIATRTILRAVRKRAERPT